MKLSAPAGELDGVLKRNRARWARTGSRASAYAGRSIWAGRIPTLSRRVLASRSSRAVARSYPSPSCARRSWKARSALPSQGGTKGFNTSGPLSYLLGTNFRQLPSNERKCLDVIPVDMVLPGDDAHCFSGHRAAPRPDVPPLRLPPSIRSIWTSIELTGLAHRKQLQDNAEHRQLAKGEI